MQQHRRCCNRIRKHLLQGSSKHEDAIGKFIAEYTLGAAKSVAGLANVKGKDVDSQMALIEAFREIENKLLQENLRSKEVESARAQETLVQFSLMQERLRAKENESLRMQEKLQTKEAEGARMQEKLQTKEAEGACMLAQFALMQEKLKQFEIMEAEMRRLAAENAAFKTQNHGKEKTTNV